MRGNAIRVGLLKIKYSRLDKSNVKEVCQNVSMQAHHLGKMAALLFFKQQSWASLL